MLICRKCHSIHDGKKWISKDMYTEELKISKSDYVLCEACKRIRDKIVYGVLYVEGPILKENRDDILKMIRKEEKNEHRHNHLSRILSIEEGRNKMTITTINQWLALHLGKQFQRKYKGRLDIDRDTSGRRGRGVKGREEAIVRWCQAV